VTAPGFPPAPGPVVPPAPPAPAGGLAPMADGLWVRLPGTVGRLSLTAGFVLGDGSYLRAWPAAAVALPGAALMLGGLLGAFHPGATYSYSLIVLALLVVSMSAGAALGAWTWLGFVGADLLLADRRELPGFAAFGSASFSRSYVPLVLSYLLLAALLVITPLLASVFRLRTAHALRTSPELARAAGLLVHAAVAAALTYFWAQSTAFLIRPLWSYSGRVPDIDAIQPLQKGAVTFAALAFVAGLLRGAATIVGRTRPGVPRELAALAPAVAEQGQPWHRTLRILLAPVQAAFLTFLVSGLLSGLGEAVVLTLILTGLAYLRLLVVPRIPVYGDLIRRVPLILRVAATVGVGWLLASTWVQAAANRGERAFTSIVVTLVISLTIAAFLLPVADTRPAPGSAP
jgi:hypothetical protein